MLMPKLQPFPIKTQKMPFLKKLWLLFTRRRQWQLVENWYYVLRNNHTIVIPKGFTFDGSSYPFLVWLFFSPTGLLLVPVILHDFCFKYGYLWGIQNGYVYKYRQEYGFMQWNSLIRRIGIERNQLSFIDYYIWLITTLFAWPIWQRYKKQALEDIIPSLENGK